MVHVTYMTTSQSVFEEWLFDNKEKTKEVRDRIKFQRQQSKQSNTSKKRRRPSNKKRK